MKKNTYKIMPIILVIMVMFSTICLPSTKVMATSTGTTTDGLYNYTKYTIASDSVANDYVEITHYNGSATEITIPDEIGGLPVTSIGRAFEGCSGLTSITIPSSVTSIGDYAFWGCRRLTSITIPSNVTSISVHAFEDCSGLTSIIIPSNVKSIGFAAFEGCSGLTSITIPSNVTSIGADAFVGCSGLTSITIPSNVKSIGFAAFSECRGLTSITILSGVTSIGLDAFSSINSNAIFYVPNERIAGLIGSEYKHFILITVTGIPALNDINVDNGTDVSSIGLPTSVEVPLSNATTTSAAVTWDNGSPTYNVNDPRTYTFTGTLSLPSGVANPHDYKAVINVIVKAASPIIPPEPPIPPTPPVPIIPPVTEETTPAAVTIKGTTRVGNTLEAVVLTNDNARFTTSAGVTYEWYRLSDKTSENGDEIGDNDTYRLTSNDKSKYIKVVAKYDGKAFEYIVGPIRKIEESNSSSSSSSDDSNSNSNNSNGNITAQVKIPENIPNGWQKQSDNTWKYGENEKAVIGWKQINGIWYSFDSNGTMETGFKQEENKTYYLENSGAMATDWELINGSWYLFDEHGVRIISWAQADGKWYYLNPNGVMATGWISLDGKWYYLYGDGSLAVSTTINGYNVDENGVWVN